MVTRPLFSSRAMALFDRTRPERVHRSTPEGLSLMLGARGAFAVAADHPDGGVYVLRVPADIAPHHLREAIGWQAAYGPVTRGAGPTRRTLSEVRPTDQLAVPDDLETRMVAYWTRRLVHPEQAPPGVREVDAARIADFRNEGGHNALLTVPEWDELFLVAGESQGPADYYLTSTRLEHHLRVPKVVPERLWLEALGWAYQVSWHGRTDAPADCCALPRELADRIVSAWRRRDPEHALPLSTPQLADWLADWRHGGLADEPDLFVTRQERATVRQACQERRISPPDERTFRQELSWLGYDPPPGDAYDW